MVPRYGFQVNDFLQPSLGREALPPQLQAFLRARQRKVDDGFKAPGKSLVQVIAKVGSEDGDAIEGFDPLQEKGGFLVGIAVLGIPRFAALAK